MANGIKTYINGTHPLKQRANRLLAKLIPRLNGLKAKLGYVEGRCCARRESQEAVTMVTYSYFMAVAEAGMVVVVRF